MEGFENIQIKRTNTAIESDKSRTINPEVTQNNIFREKETLGRKSMGTNTSNSKVITGIKKQKENEKKNRKLLKKKSENVIPEIKQVKKAKKTGKASKPISAKQLAARQKQERYQQTSETMEKLHQQFEQEISAFYTAGEPIQNYENLSRSDKDKRIKEAIKREDYAARVIEYELETGKIKQNNRKQDVNVKSKKQLLNRVRQFMEHSAKEHLLDSDESFVANLSVNYQLCAEAEYINKVLQNAAKGDYLPEELDLSAVQSRIAGLAELKVYMDNRSQLIKSPYYKYFSSDDLAYTDSEIEGLIQHSENAEFLNYLDLVRKLRAQGYKRKKGLKSINKRIADSSARRTEVLRTRQEKREIIDKMADHALNFRGNQTFRDRDHDSRFSRRLFEKRLREFNALKVSDLHLKSFKDLADNFDDNARLFEQAREFESLLVTAVRTGQHQFTDDEMIGLRAKLRVFMDAERYSYTIQSELLKKRDKALDDMSYDDIEKDVSIHLRNKANTELLYDEIPLFKLGDNLEGHLTAVKKIFKKEHDERENTIKITYGLTHPKEVIKDGKKGYEPGNIPAEELERRSGSYQKNALYADHLISLNQYAAHVWQHKRNLFLQEYSKKAGINLTELFWPGRIISAYCAGMSSEEFKKMVDVFAFGSEKDKQEVYKAILKEVENADPEEYDLRQGEKRLDNVLYKSRISLIASGIIDLKSDLKDEKDKKTVQAYADTANSHLSDVSFLHQNFIVDASLTRAMTIGDMFAGGGNIDGFINHVNDQLENNNGYFVNDKKIIGRSNWDVFEKIIKIPKFGFEMRVRPEKKWQPYAAEETESYSSDKYAGLLKHGLWKEASNQDIASIKSFYAKHAEDPDSVSLQLAKTLAGTEAGLNADNETRAKYCADAEKVFEGIMSVDPSEFAFDSYLDIVSDEERFARLSNLVRMAGESQKIISNYRKYLENKGNLQYGKQLKLNENYLKEIEARCELLGCAGGFFDGSFEKLLDSPLIKEFKTVDAMLHQSDKVYNDLKAAAKGDEEKISRINAIQDFIKRLKYFDINTPLNILEHRIRADHGILNNELSSPLEVLNVLKGTESILKRNEIGINRINITLTPEQELVRQTGTRFKEKKISVRDREKLLNNPKSGQFAKKQAMEKLNKVRTSYANGMYEVKGKTDTGYKVALDNETIDYLCNFADPESIIKDYSDKATRYKALDLMTRQIMSMAPDLNLTSDEDFTDNALKLEMITKTVYAYRNILAANPDYSDRLKNKAYGDEFNDETSVSKAVSKLLSISDYYRARRLLMTNSYYMLHENSELSRNKKSAVNDEQRKVAELYELMDKCAARLREEDYDAREREYTEQLLDRLEEESTKDAYLTGRIDETRMDAAALDKTYGKYKKLIEETGFHPGDVLKFKRMIENPKLGKYLTEDVKAFVYTMFLDRGAVSGLTGNTQEDCQYNDRQMGFLKLLTDKIKYTQKETDPETGKSISKTVDCTSFDLIDPNTGEELKFHTDPVRLIKDLAFMFDGSIAEGEFLDMMDGLLIGQKGGLDLNDPAQMAYARDRWLKSAKKLYEFERTAVKKFEQTYGNMISEIPVGFFLQSIGSDLPGFYKRMRMVGQSSLEMNDEKNVKTADGEKISVGELLVRNGLIKESDQHNFTYLSSKYQEQTGFVTNYLGYVATVMADIPMAEDYSSNATTAYNWRYSVKDSSLKGPKMSRSRRRKLWKDACGMENNYVLGGKCHLKVHKEELNLYTPDERKKLKKQRAQDRKTAVYAEAYMDERADMLYKRTIQTFGSVKVSDEDLNFIRTNLIYFHPGMYQTGEYKEENDGKGGTASSEAEVEDAYKYYRIIKDYLGISVHDGDLVKAKKNAISKLIGMSTPQVGESINILSPEDIMSDLDIRRDPDSVIYGENALITLEARHKMHLAVQDLAARDDVKQLMDENLHEKYREAVRKNLQTEIIRVMMRSDFYLDLRDIENPGKTREEREYELLKNAGMYMVNQEYMDFETEVLTPEVRKALKKYKIRIDDPVFEKKEAPKTEKADVNKTEKADVKKTEEQAGKKSEKKNSKKNEKPLNTINIINEKENLNVIHEEKEENLNVIHEEEEVPAMMAPVFEGLEYDKQGVYQYCWACTLAGLMNAHAGKQITSLKAILNKSNKLKLPTFKESGFEKQKVYDDAISLAQDMYDGNKTGNPTVIGDYVFKLLPNTAIRSAMIGVEKGTEKESQAIFRQMAEAQLKKGPFGILHNGHYVMVRGIQGDKLLVNNSLKRNPSEVVPYDYTISQIFSAKKGNMKYKQIELVWLQDMKGNEQAIADEFQFKYDGKSGRYEVDATRLKDSQGKSKETILHRDGIEGSYITNNGMVSQQIYVPKSLKAQKEQKEQPKKQTGKKEIKTEEKKEKKLPSPVKEIYDKKQKLADNLNSEADTIENAGLMHRYISENTDSFATALGVVNTLEGNKNLKDEHRSLRILLLDPARCTNRELSLKCLELEKIFLIAFNTLDMFELNFNSAKELLNEKRTRSRQLAVAMKALPPESVDFYEKMIDNKAVTTVLDKDQFKEFKARWILLCNLEPLFNGIPEIMEDAEKNNIDIDKLLTMPYAEIHTLSEESKDKDIKQIYTAILAAKEGLDSIGLKTSGNCVDSLKNERKKLGLEGEMLTAHGMVNIITRKAKTAAEYRGYEPKESRWKLGAEEPAVIDSLYQGSGIPVEDLEQIKDAARAKLKLTIKFDSALPPEEAGALEAQKKGAHVAGMDARGFVTLLRPVNIDKNGKFATKEDEENQKLNVRDWKSYKSCKLSDRVPHLDYLANEMIKNMFSPEQLADPGYIRANKERAIRCMAFMHYGREHLIDHWKYFITHKDSRIRVFAFLFRGSKYSEITEKMISTALYGYGYGSAALGNSSQTGAVVPFNQGDDYRFIKETNERLVEKSVESSGMLVRGFKTLHARGENATASDKKSKDLVKGINKDVSYGLEDLTDANKYLMIKKYGKFRKTKKFPYAQIRQDSLDIMGEFFKKKNDKNYIASVLKDIEAYMKTYEPDPKLQNGIKDDLEQRINTTEA